MVEGPRLKKRKGSKCWYAWIPLREGGTHLVSTNCTDKEAARQKARELERRSVDTGYAAAQKTTVRELLSQFVASRSRKGRASATVDFHRKKSGSVVRVLREKCGVEFCSGVTHKVLEKYIDERLAEDVAPATVKKELSTLAAAWRYGRRNKLVLAEVSEIIPELSDNYEPRTRWLTEYEVSAICSVLQPRRAAVVAFSVGSGAELSAIRRAQRADVVPDGSSVFLRGTKRKTRERTVPIPLPFQRFLIRYALQHADGPGNKLFSSWTSMNRDLIAACERASTCAGCLTKAANLSPDGRPCVSRGEYNFRRNPRCAACQATPIVERCSPNDLRRTFGQWLRNNGAEPHMIGAAMGHTDSRMVERVYGRFTPDGLARSLERTVSQLSSGEASEAVRLMSGAAAVSGDSETTPDDPDPAENHGKNAKKLGAQGRNRTADTGIFSPIKVLGNDREKRTNTRGVCPANVRSLPESGNSAGFDGVGVWLPCPAFISSTFGVSPGCPLCRPPRRFKIERGVTYIAAGAA